MDRQEHYITIGRDERAYRSFVPTPLQDIHLEMDEEMQMLLAQAHERLKNRNLSDIDALQKEEVENSVNLVYGEKKSLALAFFETDDKEDKEDKKRKLDEQNLLQATRFAVERMQKLPVSSRLLKDVHCVKSQEMVLSDNPLVTTQQITIFKELIIFSRSPLPFVERRKSGRP